MTSNITAYEWPFRGSAHIAYETIDNHIREIIGQQNGKWRDADITRSVGRHALENAIMTGYAWDNGRIQQVDYVSPMDENGHIYELVQYENHPWSFEDLMLQPTGAPKADGRSLIGFDWKTENTKHVLYIGLNGHVHELMTGTTGPWKHTDLTEATGAPMAEEDLLAAFPLEAEQSKHVFYQSSDGHVHELMMRLDEPWRHSDLTDQTGAPPATGTALIGYAWEQEEKKQVAYVGDNGNIYELVAGLDNVWTFNDLMSLTGAPAVDGTALTGFAWETGSTKEIAYVSEDRRVQELQVVGSGKWIHTDLMKATHAPQTASNLMVVGHEWSSRFAKHIVYIDTLEAPHIHSLLFIRGEVWKHIDLTDLTGAQPMG